LFVLAPFFSKRVRRYLFKAMILDILYEIVSDGKELEKQIAVMKGVINVYNEMKKQQTVVTKEEKND
jgi:2-phospho-L-lactate guanylyltransferase (CobY/MobA/RfbA family)